MIEKIQELESEINEKLKSNNVVVRILGNEDKNKGSIIILKYKKINKKTNKNINKKTKHT